MANRLQRSSPGLIDSLGAAVIATGLDGVVIDWNKRAEDLYGWSAKEALGSDVKALLVPEGAAAEADTIMTAVVSGQTWEGDFPVTRKDGSQIVVHVVDSPLYDEDGSVVGIVGLSFDPVARPGGSATRPRPSAAAAQRTRRLQEVTAALSTVTSVEEIVTVILGQIEGAFEPRSGVLALLEPDATQLRVIGSFGYSDELMDRWRTFPLDAPLPLSDAVRRQEPVFTRSVEELHRLYPVFSEHEPQNRSFFATRLQVSGRTIGGIGLGFREERDFDETDIAFIDSLAQQCAQAVERLRLHRDELEARERARGARRRLMFLAEAGKVLARSLDYNQTLRQVARLTVPELADWCVIEMVEDGGSGRPLVVEHVDGSKVDFALELRNRFPTDPESPRGVPNVLRTGHSELWTEITDEMIESSAQSEEHLELLKSLGFRSAMVVPLKARGRILGALTMVSEDATRSFDEDDLTFAEELAARAAIAIDNARLYEERSYVARALQKSLLPPRMVEIEGVEIATFYRPAAEGNQVGGDFYDMFKDGFGAWALVMGDVQGKGAGAASVTGLVRHSLRAVSMHDREPAAVLRTLNEIMLQEDNERFCTVAYSRLEIEEGKVSVTTALGGHPPPFVIRTDGTVEAAADPGLLLGAFEESDVSQSTVAMGAGDLLVLYTDGVIDERPEAANLGLSGLRELLAPCAGGDARSVVDKIEQKLTLEQPSGYTDDVAILALRVLG